jgi:hypothetical protein
VSLDNQIKDMLNDMDLKVKKREKNKKNKKKREQCSTKYHNCQPESDQFACLSLVVALIGIAGGLFLLLLYPADSRSIPALSIGGFFCVSSKPVDPDYVQWVGTS